MRISCVLVAASSLSLTSLPADALAQMKGCDDLRRTGSTTRISTNSSEGKSGREFEVLISTPGHCVEGRIEGDVRFSEDETMVTGLGPEGEATFRERRRDFDRMVRFSPDAGGGVHARMYVDGKETAFDADARAWVASLLPNLLREAAHDADGRVARYRARGGIDGALREIATIESGGSKAEIIRAVGGIDSDGDASAVLVAVARRGLLTTPQLRAAYASAARGIHSDSDRRRVLEAAERQ